MPTSRKWIKFLWKDYNIFKFSLISLTAYLIYEDFFMFLVEKPTYTSSAKVELSTK